MRKKKHLSRLFCGFLVLLMLVMIPMQSAQALTNDNQVIPVTYEKPESICSVEQQKDCFIISTKTASGKVNNFYLSFPVNGGVRFHADNEGIFKPEAVSEITYSGEESYEGVKAIVMQANGTKVKLYHESTPWSIEIYNAQDKQVVRYDAEHIWMGYDDKDALRKVKIESSMKKEELMYGLGERFNGFIQNGKTIEMWNFDSLGQLSRSYGDHNVGYKNIPILHSNEGYTVFHNNTYYGKVDVGETDKTTCSFEFYGPILDMYVWTGTPEENITRYHELTGNVVAVPKWALSFWAGQSKSMWESAGNSKEAVHETIFSRVDKYNELNTPIKNIYLEGIAAKKANLDLIEELNSKGIHSFGWMDSTNRLHDDDLVADDIYKAVWGDEDDRPWVVWNDMRRGYWWTASDGAEYVDYSNPEGTRWLKERFSNYLGKGLYGMMVDYNDQIEPVAYYPGVGGSADWMHNFSCYYYNKAVDTTFKDYYGEGGYINFARAACAGSQHYTAVFAGDQTSDFLGLSQVVSGLLSSSASGIHIWGSDIGGMAGTEATKKYDEEVYARWLAFGTFSPLMRTHDQTKMKDPWLFDGSKNTWTTEVFQKYYWTRENIVDLLNGAMIRTRLENVPLTKAMVVAYPEQTKIANNNTQYLFCDELLVCPVTVDDTAFIEVQFPEGRWVNIWDGSVQEGGKTVNVSATMENMPVYAKEGAAFPVTYGEELKIGTVNTVGKNVNGLLVTPALKRVENRYYIDDQTTQTVVCDKEEDAYTVFSETALDKPIVTAMGALADKVVVDGAELERLDKRPTSASSEPGYYRDVENNTTIIVTGKAWNRISYTDTDERLENYALNRVVTVKGLKEENAKEASNIVDGDYSNTLKLSTGKTTELVLDLQEERDVEKILVKWTGKYARSYVMEGSLDGENYSKLYTKDGGGGGTDTIVPKGDEKVRYIRLTEIESQGRSNPELSEIEVYGKDTYTGSEGQPSEQPKADAEDTAINETVWIIVIAAVFIAVLLIVVTVLIYKKKVTIQKPLNQK